MKLALFLLTLSVSTCLVNSVKSTNWGNVNVDVWGKREIIVEASSFEFKSHKLSFPLARIVSYS